MTASVLSYRDERTADRHCARREREEFCRDLTQNIVCLMSKNGHGSELRGDHSSVPTNGVEREMLQREHIYELISSCHNILDPSAR